MQDSFDITTLIFIVLAVFVVWRLRSVLGQKTGSEQPPFDPLSRRDAPLRPGNGNAPAEPDHNVVRLPGANGARPAAEVPSAERWKGIAEAGSITAQALDGIARTEPNFDAAQFLEGAKSAYEMIVTAFAQGDRRTLKDLLSRDVYEGFERAITERERRGETVETTFVSIDKADMAGAELHGKTAQIVVRFLSKLITATRDASGQIVDGSPETVADVTDVWTFARALGSRDPNWQLVATEAGQ
jgi:predicted lipid-binding transport protein (Tim44 family)